MTQLRVGIIGAGGIAGVHIAGWQQLGAHITVYSRSGAAHLVAAHGISEATTLEELLRVSDVISILTPTTSHYEYAMAAIAAGKDVLCEKPLAESAARSAEMANAARAAGVRLMPAHVVRFFPEYAAAREQLDTGNIQPPALLRLSRSSAAPAAGSWFFNEALGGGIVRDQMIHDIDQACWLAGDVARVEARQTPASIDGILPRPVTASIELTHDSGAISQLSGEWGHDGLPFSTHISLTAADGTVSYEWPAAENESDPASSSDGRAECSPVANIPGNYLPVQQPGESPYTLQIADFVEACSSGSSFRASAVDGVMAVALAEAAGVSIASGKAVDFSAAAIRDMLI